MKIVSVGLVLFVVGAGLRALAEEGASIPDRNLLCRGQSGRSVLWKGKEYRDCSGGHLPAGGLRPELLEILNALQNRIPKRIVVTSGYRCGAHNLFSWAFVANRTGDETAVNRRSLHRAGAAIDFYVEGVRDMREYRRYERLARTVAGGLGDKIWTKLYSAREARDPDNPHDYPYIHLHLRGVSREASPPKVP